MRPIALVWILGLNSMGKRRQFEVGFGRSPKTRTSIPNQALYVTSFEIETKAGEKIRP